MRKYLKNFRVFWVIIGVLAIVLGISVAVKKIGQKTYSRTNTVRTTTQRVFDYADVLTEGEEDRLEELIAKRQDEVGVDILLVTVNEKYDGGYPDSYNFARAAYFYENGPEYFYNVAGENVGDAYGYDEPYGDGVLYLDNYNRGYDGYAYSYFIGSGRCETKYAKQSRRDRVIDIATDGVNEDPYEAYRNMINRVAKDMSGDLCQPFIPTWMWIVAALVIGFIYYSVNKADKKGKKTTTATTYVIGNKPDIKVAQDVLYDKKTVTYRVQSNSGGGSGGGGGSRSSSGGHSYSGGGGRH